MRQALSTAVIIAFAAAFLPLPAFAGYGSIAWDKATGKFGWSRNQATAQKADDLARAGCGASGCEVVVRMTSPDLCGALATTKDRAAKGIGSGKTEADARLAALADCQKQNGGDCVIRISRCSK
jgi:hypothetical protein